MARPKEFEQDAALERAMNLFWEHGYEATSIRDLIAYVGISSSSIYNTFGDKQDVYRAALERYRRIEYEQVRQLLAQPRPLCETLAGMFAELIDSLMADGGQRGSFTLNAAVELGARDPIVAGLLREHFDDICALLAGRLAAAQANDEIGARSPALDLARYLLFGMYGLALIVKVFPDRGRLETTAALTLAVLDC
ncbi:TetR/AcrR family transcriptional regulator [Promineifilum sp.]|uniref:TetR/AcrR family transcriptional regulator n=1 Tax=Promineifilum sp. TaxID=2664178 RepID=UPI0035B2CA56